MQESTWEGFKRLDFDFEGHKAILIIPDKPRKDKAWIFRAEFFGAFAYADIEMAKQGFYVAHVSYCNRFGDDCAVELMHNFQKHLISEYGLNKKAIVFGFSRGGLYTVNYTVKYPKCVSVIYLDAPVLNILSWPAGLGDGENSENDWEMCKEVYGIDNGTALSFRQNPIDKIDLLIKNKIPVISVCGGADTVVPFHENMELFYKTYKEKGGNIELIVKPECGHHPHSLEDPTKIIDFIIKNM